MKNKLNQYLDAAILKPEMTRTEVESAITSTLKYAPATLCVRPCDIELAKQYCKGTSTGVCVVLGFPHGCGLTDSKVDEAKRYIALGVDEIDMVANYGYARSAMWSAVRDDIAAVAKTCRAANVPLKVIFETAFLTVTEIEKLTEICIEADADYVKTSTGFGGAGATDEGVKAMVATAQGRIKIKPSGGIRDAERAQYLINLGTHRLGVNYSAVGVICGENIETPPSSAESY